MWDHLNASFFGASGKFPINAIFTFHDTMSISPLQLPNITSAAVFVLSSVDHLNKQNFTAIKTDSKQNIRVSAKWIVLHKTISAIRYFFFTSQMRFLEKILHATNLAAAILNTETFSNLTGVLRLTSSYSIQDESIPIRLMINDQSIDYFFHGIIKSSYARN